MYCIRKQLEMLQKRMLKMYIEANQVSVKNVKPQAHPHHQVNPPTIKVRSEPQQPFLPTHLALYKFPPAVFVAPAWILTPLTTTLLPFTPVILTSTLSVPNPLAFSKKL